MANKYLKGGALNPAWCNEQDAAELKENLFESIMDALSNEDLDTIVDLELAEGVNVNLSKPKNMCSTVVDIEKELEAKFNFIKKHSGTPEDLELAREIVGLK